MKKQILSFALTLALIAGTSVAFGQAVHYSAPRPLSCTPDALHPIAGQPWTYEATASVAGTYHFWATKDPNFILTAGTNTTYNNSTALTTPTDLLYASANYNNPGTTASVDITWSTAILANTDYQGTPDPTGATLSPTFVAVYFDAANGCSDNFKVWELDPLNGFTVDVLAIDPDAVTTTPAFGTVPTSCFDNVESATYSGGAMVYNYGDNYMYFEFVASNFTGSWIPTFALTGTNAVQTVTYQYTTDLPATWGAGTTWTNLVSGTTSIPTAETNTSNGVSVFVRVLIDHANFEGIASQTLTMTLDGQNSAGQWDVRNDDCALPNPNAADQNDVATSTFNPRPAITPGTTSPIVPNTTIIPGNNVN